MRQVFYMLTISVALAAASTPFAVPAAHAGTIERACVKAGRARSAALCDCIQRVADFTLSRSEQRKAARFFSDPQRAQDTRMSDRSSDERFWNKYKEFGNAARAYCASS